jgi:hypothetical protein
VAHPLFARRSPRGPASSIIRRRAWQNLPSVTLDRPFNCPLALPGALGAGKPTERSRAPLLPLLATRKQWPRPGLYQSPDGEGGADPKFCTAHTTHNGPPAMVPTRPRRRKRPGRCSRRCGSATLLAIVEPKATTRRKEGPGVGPGLLKRACWETRQSEVCECLTIWGRTVSAKCQERISERRCPAAKSLNPCGSTYLAKPPVHVKRKSSDDGVGDMAVAEDASGTKL